MRRSTKITIGVIVFLLICLIVGLTLYFVLRKKPSSSSPPSPPSPPSGSTPYSRYQESKSKLKDLYTENQDLNSKIMNLMKELDDIYNKNKTIHQASIIIAYNETENNINTTIKSLNDIYTFIGNYDDSAHMFSVNKKAFQTQFAPEFNRDIENFRKMIFQKGEKPHDYAGNALQVFQQLQMTVNGLIKYLDILVKS
jgi:hypothetical protein